jgi:hypothetical protein
MEFKETTCEAFMQFDIFFSLYIGFYKSLYNYVENLLLKRPQKKPFLDIFQISG